MSLSHIYRMYTDYLGWHLDFTGPQMLLTQSLTSLAFQVHDGRRLAKGEKLEDPYLAEKAVKKLPSLPEVLSFVYFFPAFLAGPSHQFSDFRRLCDGSLFPNGKCPSTAGPTIWAFVRALMFAPAFYLVTLVPLEFVMTPVFRDWPVLKVSIVSAFCHPPASLIFKPAEMGLHDARSSHFSHALLLWLVSLRDGLCLVWCWLLGQWPL